MKKIDLKFFEVARVVSETSDFPRIHIGAVIVLKHDIVSVGVNQQKTHPIQKHYNINRDFERAESANHFIHAEMDALRKVKYYNLKNAAIYIYRENKSGNLAMSKPCNACMAFIKHLGIQHIFYTGDNGYCYE